MCTTSAIVSFTFRSNRTIVGLKPPRRPFTSQSCLLQQSHHCGIETMFLLSSSKKAANLQQSHHCGIETCLRVVQPLVQVLQQSHHCGIETRGECWILFFVKNSSNRTIVGLKPSLKGRCDNPQLCSNRTIVGLKPSLKGRCDNPQLCSNRTIVGLKQRQRTQR